MNRKTLIIAVIAIMALIIVDQLSKQIVADNMTLGQSVELIPSFLYLTYHINTGAAWGMFAGQMTFFLIVSIIALAIFFVLAREMHFSTKPFFSVGVVLLIGGTIGNLIDRMVYAYVIDFIDVYIFSYDFPIFNVADMALTIGWIALAIDIIFLNPKRDEANANNNSHV